MRRFLFLETAVPIYKVTRRHIPQDSNSISKHISVDRIRQLFETFRFICVLMAVKHIEHVTGDIRPGRMPDALCVFKW
jgi:hypothetical protein